MLSSHKCSAKYQKNQGVFGLKCPLNIVEIGNILKKCFLRKSIGSLKSELITCAQKVRSRRSNCHASYCPVGNCHPNSCHLAPGFVLPLLILSSSRSIASSNGNVSLPRSTSKLYC